MVDVSREYAGPPAIGRVVPSTTEHHRFATVHGVRVHWTELGESVGPPPLVLLHGLNDCHRTWRQLAPRLALRRRVLMPDLPGHGLKYVLMDFLTS